MNRQFAAQNIRRKAAKKQPYGPEGGPLSGELSQTIQAKRGGGQPLTSEMLQDFSEKFGRNMADVRVHHDPESAKLNARLHSGAFTVGSDIFLGKDVDVSDKEAMTHELTHVAQTDGKAPAGSLNLGAADTPQEKEASDSEKRGGAAQTQSSGDTVQRGFFGAIGRFFKWIFGRKKRRPAQTQAEPISSGWEIINSSAKKRAFEKNIDGDSQGSLFENNERDEAAKFMPGSGSALIDDGYGLIDEAPSEKSLSALDDSFSLSDEEPVGAGANASEFSDEGKFEPMDMHSGFEEYTGPGREMGPEGFDAQLLGRDQVRINSSLRDVVPDAVEKCRRAREAAIAGGMGENEMEALREAMKPLCEIRLALLDYNFDKDMDDSEQERDYYGIILGDEFAKSRKLIEAYGAGMN